MPIQTAAALMPVFAQCLEGGEIAQRGALSVTIAVIGAAARRITIAVAAQERTKQRQQHRALERPDSLVVHLARRPQITQRRLHGARRDAPDRSGSFGKLG